MYSILLKMPPPNYLLLKHLIWVLLKIKTSSKNNLDTYILSVRIAPHVLWDTTCRNSLFGSDLSKKVRGYDFSLWEQSSYYDAGIRNTSQRSVMLKDTKGLPSSGVVDSLIYFRKNRNGDCYCSLRK